MNRSAYTFRHALIILGALLLATTPGAAFAQVVAFGASVVSGYGVPRSAAYPEQLEAMLRAKGLKVTVKNAGVFGDTSARMLARLNAAIPPKTKVVILDTSGELLNNRVHGIPDQQGQSDIALMTSRLEARGIVVIPESTADLPMSVRQNDGMHLTEEGHREVAARLVDAVIRALGQGG